MPLPLTPPELADGVLLARYPFLPQARSAIRGHMKDNALDLDGLVEVEWLEEVRERGRVRLIESIIHRNVDAATTIDIHTAHGQMVESLSYLYAMLIVCASYDERLLARWAEGEASRADNLFGTIESSSNFGILSQTYLSDSRQEGDNWWIPMIDFIELCPKITGRYWRLPNRPLLNGWVEMSPDVSESSQQRLARLIKERIRSELIVTCRERMEGMDEDFAANLAEEVGRVVGLLQHQATTEVSFTATNESDWPPCLAEITTQLNQSVNVNHVGRVFLASISRVMGLSQEQAAAFFVNAPDFNEETTRYQVAHVFENEYTPHGCGKLQINACCPVSRGDIGDSLCAQEWMDHPLKYLRIKQRDRHREDAEPPTSDSKTDENPDEKSDEKPDEKSDEKPSD